MSERFQVTEWHRSNGSGGSVVDTKTGRVEGKSSSVRNGPHWRESLETLARKLNEWTAHEKD